MSGSLADATVNLEGMMGSIFGVFGILLTLYGILSFGKFIFCTENPDDYLTGLLKSTFGTLIGGALVANTFNSETVVFLKYFGVFIGGCIIGGILGLIGIFIFHIFKYKKYIKITNELLLLSDEFLVLSSNLQTIEDQIALNSKMAEKVSAKKKEEITFLNSLLTKKRVRFDGIIADVRASVSL